MLRHRTEIEKVNAGPDREGLEEFLRRSDRGTPLHFVGRQAEIRRLETVLNDTLQAYKTGDGSQTGNTQLITAAPGAGKSALLEELGRRWETAGCAHVARVTAATLHDLDMAFQEIVLQLNPEAAKQFETTKSESDAVGASYGVHLVKTTGKHLTQRWPRTLTEVSRWLAGKEDRLLPLVLLVDEVQTVGLAGRNAAAPLREAHEGIRRHPVMLVLAGLSDSVEVLQDCGISRLEKNSQISLGGLSVEEQREAVQKFFRQFRIRGNADEKARWAEAITEETSGWPQHLASGLSGAAEAIISGEGDLAQSSLEAALARASAHRHTYYDRQTKPFQKLPELLAEVFGAISQGKGATGVAMREAINRAYKATPHLANEIDRSEVFAKLLHQGLVQDCGHDHYDSPIPSMRRYVEAFCAERGCPVAAAKSPAVPAPAVGMDMGA